MSILPLFLIVGVALSLHISGHGNNDVLQPIISTSQRHRICAELCISGLGGESCGDNCMDIVPQDFPVQLTTNRTIEINKGRRDACPILCAYYLGNPLCNCDEFERKTKEIDFVQICGTFCIKYNYQINGCQSCDIYLKSSKMFSAKLLVATRMSPVKIDWNQWCLNKCLQGEGGAACNCDILPLRVKL